MPIPDYQAIMRPLLTALSDGTERRFNDVVPILEDQFRSTDDERAHLLPSGKQPTFRNRVHWRSFYVLKAGLVERPRRGHLRLTEGLYERLRASAATPPSCASSRSSGSSPG